MFRVSYRKGGHEFHVLAPNRTSVLTAAGKLLQFFVANPYALHREDGAWIPSENEHLNIKLRNDHVSISPSSVDRTFHTPPEEYIKFDVAEVDYYEVF